jgi:hydroxymethylglutaryl-CoA reductase
MTAPTFLDAQGLRELSQRVSKVQVRGDVEQQMTIARASVELGEASRRLDALAAVTAERDEVMLLAHRYANQATNAETERDQARQMLADAEKKIASMELDESLREEDERFADPL